GARPLSPRCVPACRRGGRTPSTAPMLDPCAHVPSGLMCVTRGDEAELPGSHDGEQAIARRPRHVADVRLILPRTVSEEWLVQHQAERTRAEADLVLQPRELLLLLDCSRPQELRVEPDQLPVVCMERPAIGTEEGSVILEPGEIERMLGRHIGSDRIVA